jgi:hypothetical protein
MSTLWALKSNASTCECTQVGLQGLRLASGDSWILVCALVSIRIPARAVQYGITQVDRFLGYHHRYVLRYHLSPYVT